MTAEPPERASGPPLGASAVPWSVCAGKPRAWVVIARGLALLLLLHDAVEEARADAVEVVEESHLK